MDDEINIDEQPSIFLTKEEKRNLKFLEELIKKNTNHKFKQQIEQYIESHNHNIVGNTPRKTKANLIEFFPEVREFFSAFNNN